MLSANLFNWKKTRARVCDKLLCFDALAGDAAQSKGKAAGKKRRMRCRLGAAVALVVPGLGWEVLFLVPFPGP